MKIIFLLSTFVFAVLAGCTPMETPVEEPEAVPTVEESVSFFDTFETYRDFKMDQEFESVSLEMQGLEELTTEHVNHCPPNPDGICGYNLIVFGPADYAKSHNHTYYLGQVGGAGIAYYGPFKGDLNSISTELESVKELTEE